MVLSGCSSNPTASKAELVSFQTLDDLKAAFVSAGGSCPSWSENDDIQAAAQSGICRNGVTLSTYLNGADLLGEVKLLRDLASGADDGSGTAKRTELLIGSNWLVAGPSIRDLQAKLGGQLAVINPAAAN